MNAHMLRRDQQNQARSADSDALADGDLAPHELLEGVVAASRALLEATELEQGLALWLARLAGAVRANRATYGSLGTHAGSGGGAHVRIGWARSETTPDSGTVIHETEDCVRWFDSLRRGETVHAQVADLKDAGTNRMWKERDCQSILLVPVVVDGRSMGWLGFEWQTGRRWPLAYQNVLRAAADSAEITIKRIDAEHTALSEREARLSAERQRAETAEADAQSVRVREELIQGVTEAAQHLLGPGDFDTAVTSALAALGAVLKPTPDSVALVEDLPTPEDRDPGRWRLTHEWHRPDQAPQMGSDLERGNYPSRDWWDRINSSAAVIMPADFLDIGGPHKILALRVIGPVRRWLTVAFEDTSDNYLSSPELAVLQTAAACVGVGLQRREAEAERLAQERKRTEEALALSRLLEGVLVASRALLESTDFGEGMERWLADLAQALDADGAMFEHFAAGGAKRVAQRMISWVRPGTVAHGVADAASAIRIDLHGQPLECGQVVWLQRESLADAAAAGRWESLGIQTALLVPVVLDGQSEAFLTFDWATRKEWRPAYGTVMRTAADGAAAAIKRNEAIAALVAERERSANERSAELAKTNAVMQRTLARLAISQNIDTFLSTALFELHQHANGVAAYLFVRGRSEGDPMRLRASFGGKGLQAQVVEDDPPHFVSDSEETDKLDGEALTAGRMIWREVEHTDASPHRPLAVHRWHQRKGHRGEARYLLRVGDRTVGMVVLAFMEATPLTESQCELLVALSQPIALALELSRLGAAASQAARARAVLAERNRMARDVHDTLAQGFTAISLQLQAATLAGTDFDRKRFIARAAFEARSNLAESRRTIRILRGVGSPDGTAGGLVGLFEGALESRLSGSPIEWQVSATLGGIGEPALSDDARRELTRIAQEAATNALKHAHASTFEIDVSASNDRLTVKFSDDGQGFDTRARNDGFGLVGMRERAERMGATIQFHSRPGGPTAIVVTIATKAAGEGAA